MFDFQEVEIFDPHFLVSYFISLSLSQNFLLDIFYHNIIIVTKTVYIIQKTNTTTIKSLQHNWYNEGTYDILGTCNYNLVYTQMK